MESGTDCDWTAFRTLPVALSELPIWRVFTNIETNPFRTLPPNPSLLYIDPSLQETYKQEGMRVSVAGVVLVHDRGEVKVLMASENRDDIYSPDRSTVPHYTLPSVIVDPKSTLAICRSKLHNSLCEYLQVDLKDGISVVRNELGEDRVTGQGVEVGALVATYWRTRFDAGLISCLPRHCDRPVEVQFVFKVEITGEASISLPVSHQPVYLPVSSICVSSRKVHPAYRGLDASLCKYSVRCYELYTKD